MREKDLDILLWVFLKQCLVVLGVPLAILYRLEVLLVLSGARWPPEMYSNMVGDHVVQLNLGNCKLNLMFPNVCTIY